LTRLKENMRLLRNSKQQETNFSGMPKKMDGEEGSLDGDRRQKTRRITLNDEEDQHQPSTGWHWQRIDGEREQQTMKQRVRSWDDKEDIEEEPKQRPKANDSYRDPLFMNDKGKSFEGNFQEQLRQSAADIGQRTSQQLKNARENWEGSDFFGDHTGSSHISGPYRLNSP